MLLMIDYNKMLLALYLCICFVFTTLHLVYIIFLIFPVDYFGTVMHALSIDVIQTSLLTKAHRNCLRCVSPSKKFIFVYFIERPLKMMKNVLHFILKSFFQEIFTFCPDFLVV